MSQTTIGFELFYHLQIHSDLALPLIAPNASDSFVLRVKGTIRPFLMCYALYRFGPLCECTT
jgi:hypothetical protein